MKAAPRLELLALPGVPRVAPGDDLAALILAALARADLRLSTGDVVVVTSKLISRAEGRFFDLSAVAPSEEACALAAETGHDPRLATLILGESSAISRQAPGVLVVRHRLGFVVANAGIDASNAAPPRAPPGSGPWVLLLPRDPDGAARALRRRLGEESGVALGVVVTDSFGRPFRLGTVGTAIGVSGLPALCDLRGARDLDGRPLERTITGLADQVAAAADLVAGQAAEGRGVVLLRGLSFAAVDSRASELCRPAAGDLYA